YRGSAGSLPAGTYVFADYCSGEIWQLDSGGKTLLVASGMAVSSFGEDEAGEIYVVDLGGRVSRIAAGPPQCTFSLSPTRTSVAAAGQPPAAVTVAAQAGCPWSAQSNASWIDVTAGGSGVGGGSVSYRVDANPARQRRVGTLTIAGKSFTVTQAGTPGAACRATFTPSEQVVPSSGATGHFAVSISAGCGWTAVS